LAIALIGSHRPGQTVAFSILRHGQPITLYVTMGYRDS
jgi:S1-C subfamily serine protease